MDIIILISLGFVLVYGSALAALLHRLQMRRRPANDPFRPPSKFWCWYRRVSWVLAGLLAICAMDGFWVEPYAVEVTHTRLDSAGAPTDPIRIVHITDTHSESKARLEPSLPKTIRALRPDVIVFTGDTLNEPAGLVHFRGLMSEMAGIAPTFAVRGNWDVWYWHDLDLFGGTGVHVLEGDWQLVTVRGVQVWVGGAAVDDDQALERLLLGVPKSGVRIALHHYPHQIQRVGSYDVELMLAGDTHGGQVRLPWIGPLIQIKRSDLSFDAGMYTYGGSHLYVNRGIGMEGGSASRVRFLCRPEVALIEIGSSPIPQSSRVSRLIETSLHQSTSQSLSD